MKYRKTIFTVTVLHISLEEERIKSSRTWGWFSKLADAEEVVLENLTDIFECLYNYAVIEEVPEYICFDSRKEFWYEADFDQRQQNRPNSPTIKQADKPEFLKNIVCFGIG